MCGSRMPSRFRFGPLRIMCGIAGIVNTDGRIVERDEIARLTDLIAHRGPDGDGHWFNAERNVALGHRRLAIIDPGPTGDQPMASADGRHIIVYNGEIYNFLELCRELEAKGVIFRSQSDTEVILAAWQVWGEEMLLRFNGMSKSSRSSTKVIHSSFRSAKARSGSTMMPGSGQVRLSNPPFCKAPDRLAA